MSIDWIPELQDDDLEVLLEALEAWESKDVFGDAMGDLMGSLLTRGDPIARSQLEHERDRDKAQRAQAKKLRKDRSVLLRAKLITIRDRRHAEALERSALRGDTA